jgi:hypothetical protein
LRPSERGWGLRLDLRPAVRLDLWALTLALGVAVGTVAPALVSAVLVPAVLVACAVVSTGAVVEATGVYPIGEGRGWIGRVHRRTDAALGHGLGLTEAAVVRGMVLGDRSLIPEELEDAFQRSGVTHVLAISGQHVAILAAVVFFGLRLVAVPPHARAGVTVLLTWLYIVVAGRHPPLSGPG